MTPVPFTVLARDHVSPEIWRALGKPRPKETTMLARVRKAIASAVAAFAVPFAGALLESSDQQQTVTQGEWITALVAAVLAGVAVWAVPNAAPKSVA